MTVASVNFYDFNPASYFSSTIGARRMFSGPDTTTGTAEITDPETGLEGETLDAQSAGESATARVFVGGKASYNRPVSADQVWTVRDLTTGDEFTVASFNVASGKAKGVYAISEHPLVMGRRYQTLDYANDADVMAGDDGFNYAAYANNIPPTTYTGTPQDDRIGASELSAANQSLHSDIYALAGNDTIDAGDGNDSVHAGAGDDLMMAGAGNDMLEGGLGADTILLEDGFGTDSLFGGDMDASRDTIDAQALSSGVTIALDANDNGTLTSAEGTMDLEGIETFVLTDHADAFDASASTKDLFVEGRNGNDTLAGGFGNDTVEGNSGNDMVSGGAGDDILEGGFGSDTLAGGTGNDVQYGGRHDDLFVLDDQFGSDTIMGGENANDTDAITGAGLTQGVSVILSGAEAGTFSDTTNSAQFTEIESLTLTDHDDVVTFTGPGGGGSLSLFGGEGAEVLGDTLNFNGFLQDGTLTFTSNGDTNGGKTGTAQLLDGTFVSFADFETVQNVICFAKGTRIKTTSGETRIEELLPGDMILTADNGPQPLRWIGARSLTSTATTAPILIERGTCDVTRDLYVSPQHRMLLEGFTAELYFGSRQVLVAAKHLLHLDGVRQQPTGNVTYYHLLFDSHEIVFANGTRSESFHPGHVGLSTLADATREEVFGLFPELRSNPGGFGEAARPFLRKHEARLLGA